MSTIGLFFCIFHFFTSYLCDPRWGAPSLVRVMHSAHLMVREKDAKLGITFEGFRIFGTDDYTVGVEWVLCNLKLPG